MPGATRHRDQIATATTSSEPNHIIYQQALRGCISAVPVTLLTHEARGENL
jgi:hypothetical protein